MLAVRERRQTRHFELLCVLKVTLLVFGSTSGLDSVRSGREERTKTAVTELELRDVNISSLNRTGFINLMYPRFTPSNH